MSITPSAVRETFERWISSPPYERLLGKVPKDEARYAWPGQYVDIEVQLAWEAWQEALNSTKVQPRWKSKALWSDGETTEDEHDTEAQARAVCRMLKRDGMGGLREVFPTKTWVEPPSHQPVPERNHNPDRSKDDKQSGTD